MKKQRDTKNLGINRSRVSEVNYLYIEKNFGKYKKCSRTKERNKFGHEHVGPNPLPIRSFSLLLNKCVLSPEGIILSCLTIPLQGACIECDRKYRRGRIDTQRAIFKNMTDDGIRKYYKENYGEVFRCSICGQNKSPESFGISRSMETGLHNQCIECAKMYSEAVGNRWAVYSPSGRNRVKVPKNSKLKHPSKDHVWSLSKGGSDNEENIKYIERGPNSSKSNSIPESIKSPKDLKKTMISKRYWPILDRAVKESWDIQKFDRVMSKAVNDFILEKSKMTDEELFKFFENEKRENNTKHDVERAVRKFREYCKNSKSINF